MTVIVIVPYRPDDGIRDQLWRFLHKTYWAKQPFDVVVGEHVDGEFNRSTAINTAADRAWDVAVIADADTWIPTPQLLKAIHLAGENDRLVSGLTMVAELTAGCTQTMLACQCLNAPLTVGRVRTKDIDTQSSVIAVNRNLWDRTGGFDERFVGWGGEDNAFWKTCHILAGEPLRIPGYAYHLWHPASPHKHRGSLYTANRRLWERYQAATTDTELRSCLPPSG